MIPYTCLAQISYRILITTHGNTLRTRTSNMSLEAMNNMIAFYILSNDHFPVREVGKLFRSKVSIFNLRH